MSWQQPTPGPDGHMILKEMSHSCVGGCSGWWKLPAAEQADVMEPDTDSVVGNVAQANEYHRTEWSQPFTQRHSPTSASPGQGSPSATTELGASDTGQ